MFADRADAGRRLAALLEPYRAENPVVVGLPRGGVVVAAEVADALDAPLDVILVRKLGLPANPEVAMGAIGEGGVRVLDDVAERVPVEAVAAVERRELAELERRTRLYRPEGHRVSLANRTVVVVDDGIATGSTALAACRVARGEGAARVVLAAPVAPHGWERRFGTVADEYVAVTAPRDLRAIGRFYDDFRPTTDDEVLSLLGSHRG
ncbi:MAG: phosphoribosyltransferase family protein [Acidimicrobiia bacterium]